ncbi:hypothetical protein FB45DRAFT_1002025 [Roridomyces roridus]|uniref:Mid2 domain-containing protein n=1 Tax=Roridomyces roridus TaxID=1738132 RepID=A0AAD7BYI5_9AGAR|nr:hypothetical protein FB45DRAFT_1002025 [Roridomyces roridus]
MSSAAGQHKSTTATLNTPTSAPQCSALQLTWSGGTPPYTIQVLDSPDNSQPALFSASVQDTTATWSAVDAVLGAELVLELTDATGNVQTSAPFEVSAGSGNGCIGGTKASASAAGSTTTSARSKVTSATGAHKVQNTASSSGISTSTSSLSTSSPAATSVAKDGSPAIQSKSTPPTGAIVGIVIGVVFFLSLLSVFLWFRYRRRRRYHRHGIEAPVSFTSNAPLASEFLLSAGGSRVSTAPLPSALTRQASQASTSNAVSTYAPTNTGATVPDRRSAVSARQEFLASEMRAMQEKMQLFNLEELELERTRAVPESNSGGGGRTSRIMRFVSRRDPNSPSTPSPASSQEALTGTPRDDGDSDLESQLQVSRAQNDVLAARIRQLEEQMQSDWALGLSDEAPPGYEVDSVPVG